jgi:carbonic anhydrase
MKNRFCNKVALFAFFVLASHTPSLICADDPSSAYQRLIEGNKRYIEQKLVRPNQTEATRELLTKGQDPFAVIISCSDSRVPPEIIFDQGLGDLFVVRVAGNIVGPVERDSIEYAAEKLHTPLILVLGHQNCGAVQAVIDGSQYAEDIPDIAPFIEPAVIDAACMPGNRLTNSIRQNVKHVIEDLQRNPKLASLIKAGTLSIVGGYYNLENGVVDPVTVSGK